MFSFSSIATNQLLSYIKELSKKYKIKRIVENDRYLAFLNILFNRKISSELTFIECSIEKSMPVDIYFLYNNYFTSKFLVFYIFCSFIG